MSHVERAAELLVLDASVLAPLVVAQAVAALEPNHPSE